MEMLLTETDAELERRAQLKNAAAKFRRFVLCRGLLQILL